jgi:hypothetical protein
MVVGTGKVGEALVGSADVPDATVFPMLPRRIELKAPLLNR